MHNRVIVVTLSVSLSVCLSVYLLSVHLSIFCLSVCLSVVKLFTAKSSSYKAYLRISYCEITFSYNIIDICCESLIRDCWLNVLPNFSALQVSWICCSVS